MNSVNFRISCQIAIRRPENSYSYHLAALRVGANKFIVLQGGSVPRTPHAGSLSSSTNNIWTAWSVSYPHSKPYMHRAVHI